MGNIKIKLNCEIEEPEYLKFIEFGLNYIKSLPRFSPQTDGTKKEESLIRSKTREICVQVLGRKIYYLATDGGYPEDRELFFQTKTQGYEQEIELPQQISEVKGKELEKLVLNMGARVGKHLIE